MNNQRAFQATGAALPIAGARGFRFMLGIFCGLSFISWPAAAKVEPFPPAFHTQEIKTDGATLHVRVGGTGPAIVMLHGFGDTGDMWEPLAAALLHGHTIVVPDLRGMGLSSHPEGGYDKKTEARDVAAVLDTLNRQSRSCDA